MKRILVAEISGKRPGTAQQRPTEKFETKHDKVIVSNDSTGYTTDWPIVSVPDDYRDWYKATVKNSENAWYAPMNRSYAIKYAREHGYDYLVQLDDNVLKLAIESRLEKEDVSQRRRVVSIKLFDDFVDMFACVLDNTNAAMVGASLNGIGTPESVFLAERYCYSIFMLNLSCCPDVFQGDFEDDIEYRLKCGQIGRPVVQVPCLQYGKTGQQVSKDLTGCREEYLKQGIRRGEHMSKLYGDVYKAKMTNVGHNVKSKRASEAVYFKHILKPWSVGIVVYDYKAMEDCLRNIFRKHKSPIKEEVVVKTKHKKVRPNDRQKA